MYWWSNWWYVAIADWTVTEFLCYYDVPKARVILNWIVLVEWGVRGFNARFVVLGDWRNFNKGRDAIAVLEVARSDLEFRKFQCIYEMRYAIYD